MTVSPPLLPILQVGSQKNLTPNPSSGQFFSIPDLLDSVLLQTV